MKTFLLSIGLLILTAGWVNAEIYTWTGEDGKVYFSDTPPQSDNKYESLELQINSYESPEIESVENNAYDNSGRVVMYSTRWCSYCKKARNYFKANNIDFIEYDIEQSDAARRRYNSMTGRGVPLIIYGNKKLSGFNVASFEKFYSR